MTALIIIAVLVLVFFLLGCIRFGGTVLYDEGGPAVWVRVLWLRIKVFPRPVPTPAQRAEAQEKARKQAERNRLKAEKRRLKEEEKREKAEKKKLRDREKRLAKEQKRLNRLVAQGELTQEQADGRLAAFEAALDAPPAPPKKKGGGLGLLLKLIPVGLKALGELKDALRFDELIVEYTIPGKYDPAGAALQYGAIAAGSDGVAALLDSQLNIRSRRVSAWVDFFSGEALVWARLTVTLSVGDVVLLALRAGFRAAKVYLAQRRETRQKAQKKKQVSKPNSQKTV